MKTATFSRQTVHKHILIKVTKKVIAHIEYVLQVKVNLFYSTHCYLQYNKINKMFIPLHNLYAKKDVVGKICTNRLNKINNCNINLHKIFLVWSIYLIICAKKNCWNEDFFVRVVQGLLLDFLVLNQKITFETIKGLV